MALETWNIDPTHSSIGFTVRHMVVAKVHGRFKKFDGKISLDGELPKLHAEVTIDASSIDTQVDARDNHLRSPDFFDAQRFPMITFQSTRAEASGKDRFKLVGDLTIRGVTREVSLEAELLGRVKDPWGQARLAFSAKGSLDRTQFGLTWNNVLESGGLLVGERIDLELEVEAVLATGAAPSKAA